ncbi:MAG: DUF2752 domain-containing protein [Corynebacteriales bacterium]|nr:DUF2752 domain-containing protein [Mycobacteriales bacterium]
MSAPTTAPTRRSAEGDDGVGARVSVLIAAAVGAGAIAAAVALPRSMSTSGPVLCPFRVVTGLPCPGCGLTRSWIALGHGDVATAFSYNVFGPISMAFVAAMIVLTLAVASAGPARIGRVAGVARHPVVWLVAGLWIAYGVARAIDAGVGTGWFPPVT